MSLTRQVLLVDDNEAQFNLTSELLKQVRGVTYEVQWANSVRAARRLLTDRTFDIVLVDYSMPGGTGVDLIRWAYKDQGLSVPFIVLSSHEEEAIDTEAMAAGAADYLVKGTVSGPWIHRAIRYAIDRTKTAIALRQSEERYNLAVLGSHDGIWDWDVVTGVVYYSPRWKHMLGHEENEVGDALDEWLKRVHPSDAPRLKQKLEAQFSGGVSHFQDEHRMRHKDGTYRWCFSRGVVILDSNGQPRRMAGSQTDVTERMIRDPLTGLPNRRLFADRLERALTQATRMQESLAVMVVNIDRFKVLNDGYGHKAGDELLRMFAERLRSVVRTSDTVAYFGNDEFTVLLEGRGRESSPEIVASRIQSALQAPFSIGGQDVFVTASMGTVLSQVSSRPEDLLQNAHTALHRAKAIGGSRHEMFDPQMSARATQRFQLENDLRRVTERGELILHYQPIIDLKSGTIAGFESLIRWRHPTRGFISPMDFIPIAEQSGAIIPIGRWVLGESCRLAQQYIQAAGVPLIMSCNLSPRQFRDPKLTHDIRLALEDSSLAPQLLKLELTETAIMEDVQYSVGVLKELRDYGVQVVVDDFGTGYSSLAYLSRMPVDGLKVDRSFVKDLDSESSDGANLKIVRTITMLAHSLSIEVTAEGVETQQQLDAVRSVECEFAQGYLFAKPMPEADALSLLKEGKKW